MNDEKAQQPAEAVLPPDIENAFMVYSVFCGDVTRTAHALSVTPELVTQLATEHSWDKRLKPLIDLKASTRAGDVERAINRAINFTQSHRLRLFLERVLRNLCSLSPTDLQSFLFPIEVKGRKGFETTHQSLTTRALADLASALEKAHTLTYLALNDTATERKERKEEGSDDATAAEMHVRLASAMAASGGGSLSSRVADAQLLIAQEFARVELHAPESDVLPADGI